jgi:hypothetical protein
MSVFLYQRKANRSRWEPSILLAERRDWMTPRSPIIKPISFLLLTCSMSLMGFGRLISVSNAILQTATVSVSPSSVTIPVNQNFTINVTLSGVGDLYGWELQLGWNSTILDAVDVSEGPFLRAGGSTFFTYTVNATAGNMIVECTLTGPIPGVSGDGTLATITFYVKNFGECPLDLYDVILLNSLEQSIQCQTVGGYGYFTPAHDVAVTYVTALPTTVLPGDIVNINVTIKNQGNYEEVLNVTVYANSQVIGVQSVSLGNGSSTTITFAWSTTGFGKGDYTVLALASVVSGEVNTANNSKEADNIVTILNPGHDVAVIGVASFKTVVGQRYSTNITVSVKNYGIFSETFNTTTYVNATAIQTQTVTLTSGNSTKLQCTLNTTGFVKGNYTLSACAWPVPGETDTTDNTLVDGWVVVAIAGDLTGPDGWPDGKVDMRDIACVAKAFGTKLGYARWNPNADVTGPTPSVPDGKVDMRDISVVAKNFGKKDP